MPLEPLAVLFSYDPKTEKSTADPFVGCEDGTDPISRAWALKESIEDDFPGFLWSVTGNDAAKALRSDALVSRYMGPPETGDPSGNSSANHHG